MLLDTTSKCIALDDVVVWMQVTKKGNLLTWMLPLCALQTA